MSSPDSLLSSPALALLPVFATSLALGLLMGLERERKPSARAGLRTFALTALLGTVCGLLAAKLGATWLIAAGLGSVALAIVGAYVTRPSDDGDPGTTTEIALLLCYLLGVLCWYEERSLAIGLGVAATVLLQFKTELAGLVRRLSPDDVRSMLQFAVLSLVILPVLPNQDFGPYKAFNPYQTWLMVVLISGVGLAGYLALRVFGQRAGVLIAGLLGGLVSSTATMLVHARQAQQSTEPIQAGSTIVVVSNLTVLIRLMVIGAIAAPAIAGRLSLVLGSGLLGGLLIALPMRKVEQTDSHMAVTSNPTELKTALGFAAMYSLVLLAAAWLNNELGQVGLYAVALLSGATDVDAITLSSLHMYSQERLQAIPTMIAIVLAVAANTIFKLLLAFSIGGRHFGLRVVWPMLAAVVSSILALWVLPA